MEGLDPNLIAALSSAYISQREEISTIMENANTTSYDATLYSESLAPVDDVGSVYPANFLQGAHVGLARHTPVLLDSTRQECNVFEVSQ